MSSFYEQKSWTKLPQSSEPKYGPSKRGNLSQNMGQVNHGYLSQNLDQITMEKKCLQYIFSRSFWTIYEKKLQIYFCGFYSILVIEKGRSPWFWIF